MTRPKRNDETIQVTKQDLMRMLTEDDAMKSLLQTLQTNTRLATSSDLTLATACTHSQTVKHWKHSGWALDNATPTVFALGR